MALQYFVLKRLSIVFGDLCICKNTEACIDTVNSFIIFNDAANVFWLALMAAMVSADNFPAIEPFSNAIAFPVVR